MRRPATWQEPHSDPLSAPIGLAEFAPAGRPQPEPGAIATELAGHNRPEVVDSIRAQFGQRMAAEDIADITYIVTRPRYVAVNEMLIRVNTV